MHPSRMSQYPLSPLSSCHKSLSGKSNSTNSASSGTSLMMASTTPMPPSPTLSMTTPYCSYLPQTVFRHWFLCPQQGTSPTSSRMRTSPWNSSGKVALCMIPFMYDHGWDQPHVQMHVVFWAAIENHDWRNKHNKHQQQVLLIYQGQQRCKWHNCIVSPRAFNLSIINEDVLCNTLDTILIQMCTDQLDVISVVSMYPHHTFLPCSPPIFPLSLFYAHSLIPWASNGLTPYAMHLHGNLPPSPPLTLSNNILLSSSSSITNML